MLQFALARIHTNTSEENKVYVRIFFTIVVANVRITYIRLPRLIVVVVVELRSFVAQCTCGRA